MRIPDNTTLLFIGDSITDCQRARPVGKAGGLGQGYVSIVNSLVTAAYPVSRIRILNTGISGNTVRDLRARWEQDVLRLKPDWLSVMIGINDVWRQFDEHLEACGHVMDDEYEATLRDLVARTPLKGLVLMTPYIIEHVREDDMRRRMDVYGGMVRKVAAECGAIFVDTQAAFDRVLQHVPSEAMAADRIHPGMLGHTILARAFLDAVDFDWDGQA
jgi:lysophospholipase L1-like esterase